MVFTVYHIAIGLLLLYMVDRCTGSLSYCYIGYVLIAHTLSQSFERHSGYRAVYMYMRGVFIAWFPKLWYCSH